MAKKKGIHITKIDLEKIINEFAKIEKIELLNEVNQQYRYNLQKDGIFFAINVFFRKDNTITCNVQGTDEIKKLGNELIEKIENYDVYKNVSTGTFTCNFNATNFNDLKEYLSTIQGVCLNKDEEKGKNGHVLQYISEIGDKITLTFFASSSKMLFQGYLMKLYIEVKNFIDAFEYVETEIDHNGSNIKIQIKQIINKYMPNSYTNLNEYLKNEIYDSIMLMTVGNEMHDYSAWTFQILKALEGRIKQVFGYENIIINDKLGFKVKTNKGKPIPMFNYNEKNGIHYINNKVISIKNVESKKVLEECYSYMCNHRSELFHTKQILGGTRQIFKPEEAKKIIVDVCQLVEDSYNRLGK